MTLVVVQAGATGGRRQATETLKDRARFPGGSLLFDLGRTTEEKQNQATDEHR
jgi:hypothetical protein